MEPRNDNRISVSGTPAPAPVPVTTTTTLPVKLKVKKYQSNKSQNNSDYASDEFGDGKDKGKIEMDLEPDKNKNLKTEDLLEKLGGFSYFQIFATIILISPEISSSMISLSPVLTTSTQGPYHCHSSNLSDKVNRTFDVSELCDVNNNFNEGWNHTHCQHGHMRPSLPYTSIVQEWHLICKQSWVPDSLTSLQMVGGMLGAIFSGQIADRFGRKRIFFMLIFLMSIFNLLAGLAWDVYTYMGARFITGLAVGGCYVVYINYLMEFLTPSYRAICGCVSLWGFGEMLLALLGYFLPGWRHLAWTTSLPLCLIFVSYWSLPESPRWLLCQKRTKEAEEVFEQIARWNGKPTLDRIQITRLQESIVREKCTDAESKLGNQMAGLNWTKRIKGLLRERLEYWRPLLIFAFLWFASSLVYYGVSFNMKNLSGNPYWKIFFMGLLDLPGSFSGMIFINRYGRKKTFTGFLLASTVFLLTVTVICGWRGSLLLSPSLYSNLVTWLCLLSRFCNSASTAIMACFTAESFPTLNRASSMSICAFMGYLGGIVAPQLAFLGTFDSSTPYIVFAVLTAMSSISALFLKDMNGKPLEDSY